MLRRPAIVLLAVYLLLCLGIEYSIASWRRGFIQEELERESRTLKNLLSQRVDQHDAHLTSLSALAQVGDSLDRALFLEVAAAIQRFYPRLTAMDLVELERQDTASLRPSSPEPLATTRTDGQASTRVARVVLDAALQSRGELVVLPSPVNSSRYLLVKRSPNGVEARHALSLEVDAVALLAGHSDYWRRANASLAILLPDRTPLLLASHLARPETDSGNQWDYRSLETDVVAGKMVSNRPGGSLHALAEALTVDDTLTSRTQPLRLVAGYTFELADLLPLRFSLGGPLGLAILFALGTGAHRLIVRARKAELDARLSSSEARISHASRVNSLGEMASGIAHELNQPLTAVLGQSQAGLRLLKGSEIDLRRIVGVLEANVTQARRASAILATLRDWSSHTSREKGAVSVNVSIENVVSLIDSEARRLSITVETKLDESGPQIESDPVEFEQVVFNLVRNALDALSEPAHHDPLETSQTSRRDHPAFRGLIRIVTERVSGEVHVVVSDNGRGISPDMRSRLFDPFASDKPGGMGLGLALCARIVERCDGRIEISSNAMQGATVTLQVPLLQR